MQAAGRCCPAVDCSLQVSHLVADAVEGLLVQALQLLSVLEQAVLQHALQCTFFLGRLHVADTQRTYVDQIT